jgi:flagellar hook-associated protein 3 FlgL
MRLSTAFRYDQSVINLQQRQQDLSASQTQLTSGKRVNSSGDDPTAAARAERALAAMARADADLRAVQASRNAMTLAEAGLGNAVDLMQTARETIVAAGNGAYTQEDREALTARLREIRKQMVSVANLPDGGGGYVFGGKGSTTMPFVEDNSTTPSTIVFNAAPGQVLAASTEEVNLTMDGQAIWMNITRDLGGGVIETFSAFTAMDQAIIDLEAGIDIDAAVTDGLARLDRVLGQFQTARSQAGEMLNRIDGIEVRLSDGKLAAQTEKSNAEDLDMVRAISDFQNKQTGYEAALQSYASIQKMSLFQYIS